MKRAPSTASQANTGNIEKFTGTAYDDVKLVGDNIDAVVAVANSLTLLNELSSKMNTGATIPWTDVTGKPSFFSGAWGDLSGVPSTFPPSSHSHSLATTSADGFTSAADKTKLDGVASGATANSPDVTLLSRANHTGTQAAGTITGLSALATSSDAANLTGTLAAARIADASLPLDKVASIAVSTILGNNGGSPAAPIALTLAQVRTLLNVADGANNYSHPNHTGDVTSTGDGATVIAPAAISGKPLVTAEGADHVLILDATDGVLKKARVSGLGGGGGGSPGGASGEVQFNNGGAFAGAANVEIESGNLKLMTTTDPAAPTGGLVLYASSFASRLLPKILGPSGVDTALQVGLHGNSVMLISPTTGTSAPGIIGGNLATNAALSYQFTAGSTNRWLSTERKRFQTSTTAGNASGMRTGYSHLHRGSAAGFGGFWFRAQFGMNINLNGGQKFIGICASNALLAGEPSALLNMCGCGYDSTDASTGNWQFMRNDGAGAAVKVDLGANAARNTTDGYDLVMFIAPGGSELFVRIVNLTTNTLVLDTSYTTEIPAADTGLNFKCEVRNGAVAAADNIEFAKVYIEKDY